MPRSSGPLPAELTRAALRFEEWRSHRTGRAIPAALWATASELAARYGVSRTARALRVKYYDLKKRVLSRESSPPVSSPATFVEILAAPSAPAGEVVVEFENVSGAKMRIRFGSADAPVLAGLSRAFLEVGA